MIVICWRGLALATVLGRDDKESKALVGDSRADAERAWAAVANNGAARARFQGSSQKGVDEGSESAGVE